MKFRIPLLAVALACAAFPVFAGEAQQPVPDQVIMKDGKVLEGRIVAIRMMQVFLETPEGNKTIPLPETRKVIRAGEVVYTDPDAKEDPPAAPPATPPTAQELASAFQKLVADIRAGMAAGKHIEVPVALEGKPQKALLTGGDETQLTLTIGEK